MKKWLVSALVLCCSLVLCSGCTHFKRNTDSPDNFYTRQNFDFSFIKKVAVLPFDNFTNEKFAAEHIRRLVINEILASGVADVALSGELSKVVRTESGGALAPDDIKKVGKALNAEAVLAGSVERYEDAKGGAFAAPEVSLSLIMYDTDSGSIVWSVSASTGGASFATRHFGARCDTLSEASGKVVKRAVSTLLQ